jgi:hypothetical protein
LGARARDKSGIGRRLNAAISRSSTGLP